MHLQVNVFASCTKRKRVAVPPEQQFRNVPVHNDMGRTLGAWTSRLAAAHRMVRAVDLYAGDHWCVFKGIPDRVGAWTVKRWVISAGYGIIPAAAPVASYSATMSAGHSDDVAA